MALSNSFVVINEDEYALEPLYRIAKTAESVSFSFESENNS